MIKETDTKQEFLEALMKVQSEIGSLSKIKDNPFHKSKYVPLSSILSEIKPILNSNKFLLTQIIELEGEREILRTNITHANGECLTSCAPLNVADKSNPQKYGSAITYMRRYSLTSLLGLEEDDDDGQKAIQVKAPKVVEKITPQQIQQLQGLIDDANKSIIDICAALGISALSELPKSKFENVINKLKVTINEAN
jgi:hypothetical protein